MNTDTPAATAPRRVQRVRHELRRRSLHVTRVEVLSPHVRSITLSGEELTGFVSASFDDHIKLFLPLPQGGDTVMRDYTPRHYNPTTQELRVEFALHGEGPAAQWAAHAQPWQTLAIGGPRGSFIVPMDFDWHLLAGDESALPAIARRLEELPSSTRALVLLQAADPADRRPLHSAAQVQLQWVRTGAELLAATRALRLPPGEGYAWCAGEARVTAQMREVLVQEKGHPAHAIRASAYWKQGAAGHHEDIGG